MPRPLGAGLKLRHKFLRALPQVFGLNFPPGGGPDLCLFLFVSDSLAIKSLALALDH